MKKFLERLNVLFLKTHLPSVSTNLFYISEGVLRTNHKQLFEIWKIEN